MLRIRDIMTTQVFTLEASASAEEAAWALTRRHIGGAPVQDADGQIVGVISQLDLLNPETSQWIKGEATVEDLMHPDVLLLHPDDSALSAALGMAQHHVHRLVIVDEHHRMVGIVTAMDIARAVAAGAEFAPSHGDPRLTPSVPHVVGDLVRR